MILREVCIGKYSLYALKCTIRDFISLGTITSAVDSRILKGAYIVYK